MGNIKNFFAWYGGKAMIASKIANYIPVGGMPYVEPFCGSAAIFLALNPSPKFVVLNDINRWIYNFFCVMKDEEKSEKLIYKLEWTQHSRAEWDRAREIYRSGSQEHSDVDRAWAFFVVACQSVGGMMRAGWAYAKTYSRRGMSQKTSAWTNRIENLNYMREMLMRVQVDCVDGIECITKYDNPSAVFYIDPPYVLETRKDKSVYPDEVDDEYHSNLVRCLLECRAAVVLSGYDNRIYHPLAENGWQVVKFKSKSWAAAIERGDKRDDREEVLWINPSARERLRKARGLYD